MPDNVEPLHNYISRSFSSIGGWLCNLIARHGTELIGLPFSTSEVSDKELNYQNTTIAIMEPIEISSSDSDWDIDDTQETDISTFRDSSSSSSHRVLPNWASARDTTAAYGGNGVQYQRATSPKRASVSNGNPLNTNDYSQARSQSQHVSRGDKLSGDSNHHKENKSSINGAKRALPPTLLPHGTSDRSKNLVENVSRYEIQDTHGKFYRSPGSTLMNSRHPMKVPFKPCNDDVVMFEGSTSKLRVPALMHKYAPVQQFASTSITPYRSGDERETEHDERFVYQAALEDLSQSKLEANLPEGLLSVNLLRHQKIALAWAIHKENRSSPCVGGFLADDQGLGKTVSMIALIQMQKYLEEKSKSNVPPKQETEAFNLDDDEDDKIKDSGESSDTRIVPEVSTSVKVITNSKAVAGTLVVCPASVLRQWARELDDKVTAEAKLSVLLYHGSNRTKDPSELAKYDVVITTYSIVTNEVPKQPLVDEEGEEEKNGEAYGLSSDFSSNKKRKKSGNNRKKGKKGPNALESSLDYGCGALAKVRWLRVILDEAQTIKNHRTLIARACCSLKAKRRWCLSGTPIQNTVDDLYSYFRFLRYVPYFKYKSFYGDLKVPISRNSVYGYKKLQAVLRAVMLRRTKSTLLDGEPIIKLPPKSVCLKRVDFSNEERSFYAKLEADSRSQFKAYAAAGTVNQNYANILLMLLRLRQACDHPLLVKGFNRDLVGKESFEMARQLPRDMLVNLLNLLETSLAICCVCNDPPDDAVVTMCSHVFCYQCVSDYISGDDNTCPAPECKEQLGGDVVFSKASLRSSLSGDHDGGPSNSFTSLEKSIVMQTDYCSSKIKAVLEILSSLKCQTLDPNSSMLWNEDGVSGHNELSSNVQLPSKAIIFSQWTRMLDLVEMSLKQTYIVYRRLDGTMTLAARDKAVKDFNTNPEVTVMLMSLKAGNLGLNMVAACHVILLDLWWNPTTEDQAVDRAHRIGQIREVTVSRLTIKDTVEDRILALQEDKRNMVASAFGEDHGGGSGKLTADDLKFLFMGTQ